MDERKDDLILKSVSDENELEDVIEDMWDDMPRPKGAVVSKSAEDDDGGNGDTKEAVDRQASPPPPPPKSSRLSIWVWSFVIILLLGFNTLQIMGIVMRDSLDGRRDTGSIKEVFAGVNAVSNVATEPKKAAQPPVKQDPPKAEAVAVKAVVPVEKASEAPPVVAKLKATPEPKKLIPAKETLPAKETPQVKETPQAKEQPKPKSPAKAAKAKVAAPVVGTHVVAVGVFRSQRHVTEMSKKLTGMGLPVLTEEIRKKGEGFVLRFGSATKTNVKSAVKLLKGDGYIIHEGDKGPELFFHFEDKAQMAKALVGETGAKARVDSVTGKKMPLWKVYAGPMDKSSAKKAIKKLKGTGQDCYLQKYKT